MANEGSTKPTYSELERELAHQKANVAEMHRDCMKAEQRVRELESLPTEWEGSGYSPQQTGRIVLQYRERQAEIRTFSAELARVRGLLQRLGNAWEMDPHGDEFLDIMGELGAFDDDSPTFPQSSSLVSQGTESADIGKLDAADKSGVEMGKVNRVDETETLKQLLIEHVTHCNPRFQNLTEYGQKCANHADELARKYLHELDPKWTRGSAETGGEKADCGHNLGFPCVECRRILDFLYSAECSVKAYGDKCIRFKNHPDKHQTRHGFQWESPHSSMAEPSPYKGQVTGSSPVAATNIQEDPLAKLTTPQGNDGMVGLIVADELCGSFSPDEYAHAEHIVEEINDAVGRLLAETTLRQSPSPTDPSPESMQRATAISV